MPHNTSFSSFEPQLKKPVRTGQGYCLTKLLVGTLQKNMPVQACDSLCALFSVLIKLFLCVKPAIKKACLLLLSVCIQALFVLIKLIQSLLKSMSQGFFSLWTGLKLSNQKQINQSWLLYCRRYFEIIDKSYYHFETLFLNCEVNPEVNNVFVQATK